MANIPAYTTGIIRDRTVGNMVNPQAIADAGGTARGVAEGTDIGAQVAWKLKEANDATATNETIIKKQKDDLDWLDEQKKARSDNPEGFSKEIDTLMKKRDAELEKTLPSSAAKSAFRKTAAQLNLQEYEQAKNWETTRRTEIYANRLTTSIDDNNLLMLRAGKEGRSPDEYLKNVDAATIGGGGLIATEKLADFNQEGRSKGMQFYMQGVLEKNPYEAKKILDSKKYDSEIGADGIAKLYNSVDSEIKTRNAEAMSAKLTQAFLDNQRLADPSSTVDRKVVNKSFVDSGLLEGLMAGKKESFQETVEVVKKTSIIPEAAQTVMRGYMTNGTKEQKQMAYSFVAALEEAKPAALTGSGGFSEKEIQDAGAYNNLVRSGVTPDYALSSVREASNPLQKDVRDMRETELKKELKDMTADVVLNEFGRGATTITPSYLGGQNQAKVFADYQTVYKDAFLKYGSKEAAHGAAMGAIKMNNGETRITGKKALMQFPPEKYYGVPDLTIKENAEWMREELKADLAPLGVKDVDNIELVPTVNSKARIDEGKKPQYHVLHTGEKDGFPYIDILRGEDNMPVTVAFDPSKQLEQSNNKRMKELSDKNLVGKLQREARLQEQSVEQPMAYDTNAMALMSQAPTKVMGDYVNRKLVNNRIERAVDFRNEADLKVSEDDINFWLSRPGL